MAVYHFYCLSGRSAKTFTLTIARAYSHLAPLLSPCNWFSILRPEGLFKIQRWKYVGLHIFQWVSCLYENSAKCLSRPTNLSAFVTVSGITFPLILGLATVLCFCSNGVVLFLKSVFPCPRILVHTFISHLKVPLKTHTPYTYSSGFLNLPFIFNSPAPYRSLWAVYFLY